MTTTNTRRTDPNARVVRPGYFRSCTNLGSGVTARLVIKGDLASDGDTLLALINTVMTNPVELFLGQPGDVYDYSEPVSRTATMDHEDSKVSVTLIHQPIDKPSLVIKATGRARTAHYLQHLAVMTLTGISTKSCAEESVSAVVVSPFGVMDGLDSLLENFLGPKLRRPPFGDESPYGDFKFPF